MGGGKLHVLTLCHLDHTPHPHLPFLTHNVWFQNFIASAFGIIKKSIWYEYSFVKKIQIFVLSLDYETQLPWWLRQESICLQCGRPRFDCWVRKIPWRRKWQPTPVLLLGKYHGWRSLVGYSPWGHKELDKTEQLHFLFFFDYANSSKFSESGITHFLKVGL